jgi:hypothetical protein
VGGRAAVWLVLLVEDCCYCFQVAVLPPPPATSAHEGPMVEGRTECTAHLLPVPSYTSPHDGAEEQGRGRGGAG